MKTYLVGGAVRDELLQHTVKDRDYVVVGATPEHMLAQGFEQVGSDFPVFLHPSSKEEFALARTERKTGAGYNGFTTDFNPSVTLEEDLRRRDLTINAMAKDLDTGELVDPFGGLNDLNSRVLRHVSPAFAEDPLRVLRVARFHARYGFDIAAETLALMTQLVDTGEVDHLTAERVWLELEKAFSETNTNKFVHAMKACNAWARLFPEYVEVDALANMRYTKHMNFHEKFVVLFADTPREGVLAILERYKAPAETVRLVTMYHDLKASEKSECSPQHCLDTLKKLDVYRRPADFRSLVRACVWTPVREWSQAMHACFVATRDFSYASLTAEQQSTLKGADVGKAIDKLRLEALGDRNADT